MFTSSSGSKGRPLGSGKFLRVPDNNHRLSMTSGAAAEHVLGGVRYAEAIEAQSGQSWEPGPMLAEMAKLWLLMAKKLEAAI